MRRFHKHEHIGDHRSGDHRPFQRGHSGDVEAALKTFRSLLDAPETPIMEAPELGVRAALVAQGETRIELLEPLDPTGPIGRFLANRGEGQHYIAFRVENIESKLAQLKAAGVPLVDETPRQGLTGLVAFLHPEAAHHVLVELVEPQEHQPPATQGHDPPGAPQGR